MKQFLIYIKHGYCSPFCTQSNKKKNTSKNPAAKTNRPNILTQFSVVLCGCLVGNHTMNSRRRDREWEKTKTPLDPQPGASDSVRFQIIRRCIWTLGGAQLRKNMRNAAPKKNYDYYVIFHGWSIKIKTTKFWCRLPCGWKGAPSSSHNNQIIIRLIIPYSVICPD